MPSRLLIATFQNPDTNTGEVRAFKKHGLLTGLIGSDRGSEVFPAFPEELKHKPPAQYGIRWKGLKDGEGDVFALFDLSDSRGRVWNRLTTDATNQKILESWFQFLFYESINCLVIGGHHHRNDDLKAMVWGTDRHLQSGYYPYTGLGTDGANLKFFGYSGNKKTEYVVRNLTKALSPLHLLVINGCNGVPTGINGVLYQTEMAKAWRQLVRTNGGNPPLILGWFGTHSLPKDAFKTKLSETFWAHMQNIANETGPNPLTLEQLCRGHALEVAQAWGKACYSAFRHRKAQRHLCFDPDSQNIPEGCGAVLPDGTVMNADKRDPDDENKPLKKVGMIA